MSEIQQKHFIYEGQERDDIPRNITHLQVAEGTIKIPPKTFSNLKHLEHVDLPNSITSLSRVLFAECSSLRSIAIPLSIKRIDPYCFYRSGLTTIHIPDTVEAIGNYAFARTDLTEISFPNNRNMRTISEGVCHLCFQLKNVYFPTYVREISIRSFQRTGLEKVDLPDSLKRVDAWAFGNNNYLQVIQLPNNAQLSMGAGAFRQCPSLFSVSKPEKMTHDQWRRLLNIIVLVSDHSFSFQNARMNKHGQRAFDTNIPCKAWPDMFSRRPKTMKPREIDILREFWMSQSTFDSLIFLHLRSNVAKLLEATQYPPTARRRAR